MMAIATTKVVTKAAIVAGNKFSKAKIAVNKNPATKDTK